MEENKVDPHMWDRFDAVAVLCTTSQMHRQAGLKAELARVGLLDRVEWFWDFDNPFMVRLANNLRLAPSIKSMGGFRMNMNHYRAVKTMLELGKRHVLVLENDVRFLRDTSALADGIRAIPDDYDMAKFEWTGHPTRGVMRMPEITGPWYPLRGFDTYCTAAIAYSEKGLQWRVNKLEECTDYSQLFATMHAVDVYDNAPSVAQLHAYVASPMLAVQHWTGDGHNRQNASTYRLYGTHMAVGGVSAYAV